MKHERCDPKIFWGEGEVVSILRYDTHCNNIAYPRLLFWLSGNENILNINVLSSQSSIVLHCPSFIFPSDNVFFKQV